MRETNTRRFRLMQIGFGHIGMRRVHSVMRSAAADIVGVVDVKQERLGIARELLGDRCVYDVDFLRALATARPDGVIVSTPNHLHAPITLAVLARGVHVLCEKPLASSVPAAEQCVALARRRGLLLKVGANHRFWRNVRQLMQEVRDGAIGQVENIHAEIGYRLPDVRSEWYREPTASGGGTLVDNSPHALSVIEELLRLEGDAIASVRCRTSNDALGLEVEDCAEGSLVSRRGMAIQLRSTWGEGDYRMNIDVVGTRGRISLNGFDRMSVETGERREELDFTNVPPGESWDLDIASFIEAVRLKVRPVGGGSEGLSNLQVIAAMYESASSGAQEVRVGSSASPKSRRQW